METVYRDYASKGVQFYYIYKSVEHPEVNGYVEAYSLKERLKHIQEIKRRSKSRIPWICDNMQNELQAALGGPPNGGFILDPDGKIIVQRFWSDPRQLRADLAKLVGPVDNPTNVADIDVRFEVKQRPVASGVLPRVVLKGRYTPLRTTPDPTAKDPFFAKLRVETDRDGLQGKKGKLYVGLFLDPLYKVHWNNLAGQVEITLSSDDVKLSTKKLMSPKVKEDADIDPREFLIDIDEAKKGGKIQVTVDYMACDDAGTFCVPVLQNYTVELDRDREGGTRPNVFLTTLFANLQQYDKNKDGRIVPKELPPGRVTMFMGHIDKNDDNIIDTRELTEFQRMFNNGKGY